jgi:hypothetical protein
VEGLPALTWLTSGSRSAESFFSVEMGFDLTRPDFFSFRESNFTLENKFSRVGIFRLRRGVVHSIGREEMRRQTRFDSGKDRVAEGRTGIEMRSGFQA